MLQVGRYWGRMQQVPDAFAWVPYQNNKDSFVVQIILAIVALVAITYIC